MDTFSAFAMGEANRGKDLQVFDWDKAAIIIVERKPRSASAGLKGDWKWTGGVIFENGRPTPRDETYTYLASTWATPQLVVDGDTIDCFRLQGDTPGWDSATYWPESALEILESVEK